MSAEFAKRTIYLIGETQRTYAKRMIDEAPAGYVARIAEQTRSDAQNRMMWPLISDMQRHVPSYATFNAEDMKLRYLNALGIEMRFLPTLEGNGLFPVGQRSSTLSKSQFTALIDIIQVDGMRHGVEWSHRALAMMEDARAS